MPLNRSGTLGKAAWRTQTVPDRGAASVGAVVVRLTLSEGSGPGVSLYFLLRDPRSSTTRPAEAP